MSTVLMLVLAALGLTGLAVHVHAWVSVMLAEEARERAVPDLLVLWAQAAESGRTLAGALDAALQGASATGLYGELGRAVARARLGLSLGQALRDLALSTRSVTLGTLTLTVEALEAGGVAPGPAFRALAAEMEATLEHRAAVLAEHGSTVTQLAVLTALAPVAAGLGHLGLLALGSGLPGFVWAGCALLSVLSLTWAGLALRRALREGG